MRKPRRDLSGAGGGGSSPKRASARRERCRMSSFLDLGERNKPIDPDAGEKESSLTSVQPSPAVVRAEQAATINTEDFSLTQNAVAIASDDLSMVAIVGEAGLGRTFAVSSAIGTLERETVKIDCDARSQLRPILSRLASGITGVRLRYRAYWQMSKDETDYDRDDTYKP